MDDSFNKVIIGSGLISEIMLCSLIWHKGESPEDFYIFDNDQKRCVKIMKKYGIPITINPPEFVKKARVIVLAMDTASLDELPGTLEEVVPFVSKETLINSLTPKLSIADIKGYFPDNPIVRLSINLSSINGVGTGVFCCDTEHNQNTESIARFLLQIFGDLIEVKDEEEMEKVADVIHSITCSCYLAMNCFFGSSANFGISDEQAKKIVLSVFKGAALTCAESRHEDLVMRALQYDKIFENGLNMLINNGVAQEMFKVMTSPQDKTIFRKFLLTEVLDK